MRIPYFSEERCVMCGEIIEEGMQVCARCDQKITEGNSRPQQRKTTGCKIRNLLRPFSKRKGAT